VVGLGALIQLLGASREHQSKRNDGGCRLWLTFHSSSQLLSKRGWPFDFVSRIGQRLFALCEEEGGGNAMPVLITSGTSIDYDVQGKEPPLLLISGLGFGRWGWFKQVPTLSRHFRTITFDLRSVDNLSGGVGDLTAKVVALLDHLDIKKTHILGTSLGGS
jgi:pimeloyl-ACP methyl ester carboxylesterase